MPGICSVAVAASPTLTAYFSARGAARLEPSIKTFATGQQLEVYQRSNLYRSIVQVGSTLEPSERYWIYSANGEVTALGGNCDLLQTVAEPVINPISQPIYSEYPLV